MGAFFSFCPLVCVELITSDQRPKMADLSASKPVEDTIEGTRFETLPEDFYDQIENLGVSATESQSMIKEEMKEELSRFEELCSQFIDLANQGGSLEAHSSLEWMIDEKVLMRDESEDANEIVSAPLCETPTPQDNEEEQEMAENDS